ncbi:LodA/GoxA family CTQ-dependent oxidase [Corallococcus sp. AB045]|uniref:LodA/GoxA family CTQ-dependent oxidase n=1 Tax=Corallococcus sp. AB045 TaxID=2316719 RepID=UPI0013155B8D
MSESQAITQFAICPSIGVARVGNSPDGFFFGPELPGAPRDRGRYRDTSGRIKLGAARAPDWRRKGPRVVPDLNALRSVCV